MHHCSADGTALARVMLSLTDPTPDAAEPAIGFMVDAGLVPDPQAIVDAVDAELAVLRPPVRQPRRAVSRSAKRASADEPRSAR